jgi:hypothetical protein
MSGQRDRFTKVIVWIVVAMMALTLLAAILPVIT